MKCHHIVSGLSLFLHNNTYLLINVVPFKVVSLGLHTASPVIVPPVSALFETQASFVKKKKSHSAKLDEYGACGIMVILV
jgi:hypothetical protein